MTHQDTPKPAIAVELSANAKTGPVSATYASQASCPSSCALRGAGCYAETGMVGIQTRRLNRTKATPLQIARAESAAIAALSGTRPLRLHVVGDACGARAAAIVGKAALVYHRKHQAPVWTYTHAWREAPRAAWGAGVSILASLESPAQAPAARAAGYGALAMVVAEHPADGRAARDQEGNLLIPCPAQTKGVQCVQCRLCWREDYLTQAKAIVTFEAHGLRAKTVKAGLGLVQLGGTR